MDLDRFTNVQAIESNVGAGNSYFSTATSGLANVKGAWTSTIAATRGTTSWVIAYVPSCTNGDRFLWDLGVGAAGNEKVVLPDLVYSEGGLEGVGAVAHLPLAIPAGANLSIRCQDNNGSHTINVTLHLFSGASLSGFQRGTNYGPDPSASTGVSVDAGGSADTKGAYAQLTASTTQDLKWALVQLADQAITIPTNGQGTVDIAIGAAASEVIVFPDLSWHRSQNAAVIVFFPGYYGLPCRIPSGVRLSARAKFSAATNRTVDVAVLGLN